MGEKIMRRWYRARSRRTRTTLAAQLLLILFGGLYGVREVALRSADHLTVTVSRLTDEPDGRAGSLVYQRTFGRALAADAEHLLNDETNTGYVGTQFPPPPLRGAIICRLRGRASWSRLRTSLR